MFGFHSCGYLLWLSVAGGCVIFFDEDDTSPTRGLEVDTCPGCKTPLFLPDIFWENTPYAPPSYLS